MHKTKRALIDTVLRLMDGDPTVVVTMLEVLDSANITSGSMYYHFDDFQDLIDHALIELYTRYTEAGITGLAEIFAQSRTSSEVRTALGSLIKQRHDNGKSKDRAAISWIAAQATLQPKLQEKLGPAQLQMTQSISEVVKAGQEKGFVKTELDPVVIAVFVQAYALGRIVDDLAGNIMDSAAWTTFIKDMVRDSILTTH